MLAEPVPAPGEVLALDATLPHNPGQAPPRGVHSDSTPSSAQVPGYAVLEELGRGGMGVVYKACHLKLNRVVALKMIRGDLADSGERLRFLAEAEAVARVQHPHIVQIFETGTHDGMPFMALEFVEGGSLAARLAGSPLPAKQSAHLGEQLARAVQCAHERGVIHRDLKPANVLLTSEGTPKVTDFGLAKHIESDRGMTQTGAILGTPSYIAPEQASGQGKTIGPAADVYALGAILYECLTGRPPFKAATTLETLLQVVADDPVPPSRLQPRTPHDLETICLKCLNKDPARRYASAAGLADDLGRYLRDEPIRARSPGWPERAWRWCRRNPGMAWLAAVSSLAALALALVVATSGAIVILTNRELERTNKELEQANHSLAGAAELEREVGRLEVTSPLLHKVIRCSILVRQANAAARDGRKSEAREFLSKAIALDESARLGPIEDDRERGPLLAQLASGTEQLIDLEAQEGNVESAVVAATCRNRGLLLGQLLMTGVGSPRPKKEELGKKLSALRARARRGPPDLSALTQEFEQAQREYADISREVLDTDPICRRLGGQAITHERLAGLRERIIGPRKLLLVYHVGRERSYLLLLGDLSEPAQAYPLTIPAEGGERSAVPLGEQTLLDLVTEYQKRVRDAHGGPGLAEQFRETRGVKLKNPLVADRPKFRPELLGEALLPTRARAHIRRRAPDSLIVVPDGPIRFLPFEALLLKAGAKPIYALDELPPLVYAPSVASLDLPKRDQLARRGAPLSLLTVADPAYPEPKQGPPGAARPVPLASFGDLPRLPRLPWTAEESRKIVQIFKAMNSPVQSLTGSKATEGAVKAAVRGKRIVHIASHGYVGEGLGSKFGALCLTPPAPGKATPEDDGFLCLPEICELPLEDCELAVLSASDTNVGPEPWAAGAPIASGFLAAGARRVVASHWSSDDEATAALIVAFFEEVTVAARKGGPIPYARALQQARLRIRSLAGCSSPFFWAPFVLIGSAD